MGKKQRAKLERRHAQKMPAPRSGGAGLNLKWLWVGLGIVFLLIAAIVVIFQTHRVRFLQTSVVAAATTAEEQLNLAQMKFTQADYRQLVQVVRGVRRLGAHPALDAAAAGQLRFMLEVLQEIAAQGNLGPEELSKLWTQLSLVNRYLQSRGRSTPTAR